jgi:hypothetical protein
MHFSFEKSDQTNNERKCRPHLKPVLLAIRSCFFKRLKLKTSECICNAKASGLQIFHFFELPARQMLTLLKKTLP